MECASVSCPTAGAQSFQDGQTTTGASQMPLEQVKRSTQPASGPVVIE